MAVFQVSYDLSKPEREYEELTEVIESLGPNCRVLESVWFVESDEEMATDVFRVLEQSIDSDDRLVVTRIDPDGDGRYSKTPNTSCDSWLKAHLPPLSSS